METTISNRAGEADWPQRLAELADRLGEALALPADCELSVLLVDDAEITRANEQYLGHTGPTDVISFPQDCEEPGQLDSEEPCLLGDIMISVNTARRQAEERGHSTWDEVAFLLVHGVLHLLGRRDYNEYERQEMLAEQLELSNRLGIQVTG